VTPELDKNRKDCGFYFVIKCRDVMQKRFIIILVIIIVLFGFWMFIRGPEDTWICENEEWVKHGVPAAPKPEGPCSQADNLNPFR
jgi:hypothetical protein